MADLRRVHDPKMLRAIAHPVRQRILTELSASGSLRAADLAKELDIPANQASFHLRQLARYGLVEEDPEAARDRRDRVWRLVAGGLTVNMRDIEAAPGGRAAAQVFRRNRAAWAHAVVDEAYADQYPSDTHRSISDHALRLTKDEAAQLVEELNGLVTSWAERVKGRDGDRHTYLLLALLLAPETISAPAVEDH